MFVLLFYDKLTGFLGEGPIWFEMQTNPPCDKYWWTNLLYINNFYPTSDQASVRFSFIFNFNISIISGLCDSLWNPITFPSFSEVASMPLFCFSSSPQ